MEMVSIMKKYFLCLIVFVNLFSIECFGIINASSAPKATTATAFFITNDGYAITNYQNIDPAQEIEGVVFGKSVKFKFVTGDYVEDIAIIKATSEIKVKAIPLFQGWVSVQQKVESISFQKDEDYKLSSQVLTKGYINSIAGIKNDIRYFQVRFNDNKTPNDGPVIDENGICLGVISSKLTDLYSFLELESSSKKVSLVKRIDYVFPLVKDLKGIKWYAPSTIESESLKGTVDRDAIFSINVNKTVIPANDAKETNFSNIRSQIPENGLFISVTALSGYSNVNFASILMDALKKNKIGKAISPSLKQDYYKSIYNQFGKSNLSAEDIVKMAADLANGYLLTASCNIISGDIEDSVELILYNKHSITPLSNVKVVKVIDADPEEALKLLTNTAATIMAKELKTKKITF